MNKQFVLVEFNNTAPFIYEVSSDKDITLERVVRYFEDNERFDDEEDSLTFVDEPTKITI